jgi:hypothetical protein
VNADTLACTRTVARIEKGALIKRRSTQPYGSRTITNVDIHTTTLLVGANVDDSGPVTLAVGAWVREHLKRKGGYSKRRREKSNELCEMHLDRLLLMLENIKLILLRDDLQGYTFILHIRFEDICTVG